MIPYLDGNAMGPHTTEEKLQQLHHISVFHNELGPGFGGNICS